MTNQFEMLQTIFAFAVLGFFLCYVLKIGEVGVIVLLVISIILAILLAPMITIPLILIVILYLLGSSKIK